MASLLKVSAVLPALSQVAHVIRTWNILVIIYRQTEKYLHDNGTPKNLFHSQPGIDSSEANEEIKLIVFSDQLGWENLEWKHYSGGTSVQLGQENNNL